MNIRLHDHIREIIEKTPGLTQRGLAEKMGLDPAAVNRMLYGRRNIMAEEIPLIEEYLGVRLMTAPSSGPLAGGNFEYSQDHARTRMRGFSDVPMQPLHPKPDLMPVYGGNNGFAAERGGATEGFSLSDVVDWVPRHPLLIGIRNAFALYAPDESMSPRYFEGELVYVHPGRPPETGRDCLIELSSGEIVIRRFLGRRNGTTSVEQLNPHKKTDLSAADVRAVYTIVGRG